MWDPYYWWCTAQFNREAARIILGHLAPWERAPEFLVGPELSLAAPAPSLTNVFVNLVGIAVENLFKAEYMRRNKASARASELPRAVATHDLNRLANLIDLAREAGDDQFLRTVHAAVISWGRYPGGRRHNEGDIGAPANFNADQFQARFDSIWERLSPSICAEFEGYTSEYGG